MDRTIPAWLRGSVVAAATLSCLACKANESSPFGELTTASAQPTFLPGQPPPPSVGLKDRMKEHVVLGVAMRDAVTRADLPAARRAAQAIAQLRVPGSLEEGQRIKLDAMASAAERAYAAEDVGDAARKLARLAQSCGDCHAVFGGPHGRLRVCGRGSSCHRAMHGRAGLRCCPTPPWSRRGSLLDRHPSRKSASSRRRFTSWGGRLSVWGRVSAARFTQSS